MKRIKFIVVGILFWSLWISNFGITEAQQGPNRGDAELTIGFQDSTTSVPIKKKSPWGAVLRSAVFPGWGQWYNGKWFKAVVIFGGETGLLANSLYLNHKFQNSKDEEEREFYRYNRNLSNWWLAGAFFFSLLDAYIDAQLSDFDVSPDLSLQYRFGEDRNFVVVDSGTYVGLCLSFRF